MMQRLERTPRGLIIRTDDALMRVDVCADNIFRVVCTGDNEFREESSLIVTMPRPDSAGFHVDELPDCIRIRTDAMMCDISRETGAFIWRNSLGNVLTREPPRGGKTLNRIDVMRTYFDSDAGVRLEAGADGVKARADDARLRVDRQAWQAKLEFVWKPGEALYGLGSHEEGVYNLRGTSQYLYQQNMKATVPVLVSTEGYGILVDCCSLMTFHDDQYGSYLWADTVSQLDYYMIHGPSYDAILKGLRRLTGGAPMLPRAAFGYIQSKERYKTADELIGIVEEYRRRQLPLDMIVLDWQSWPGSQWGQKSFDPARFPDPDGMTARLHALNARMMISIWPNMSGGGEDQLQMQERGYMLGNRSTYDAFNADARALYWSQANEGLFRHGIDAWWCDCSEPFEADWRGTVKPEPEERLAINVSESKKYMDPETINAYSLLHSKGIYDGQRSVTGDKRVVNLTRSSYAGQHRYSTITWSGDISANWETLRRQIPAALNFCVTGEPYWTVDIGAFFVGGRNGGRPGFPAPWFISGDYDHGCEDLGYRELFTRWFQFGAFLPMFRAHGTGTPREVWRFGEPGAMFYEALAKALRLRYRLMPYIYSLAGAVTHDDGTMLRLPAFDFPADPQTRGIGDQYLFGPSLLVCPVTEPMYYQAGSKPVENASYSKEVYLPAGCAWYDFWTSERFEGGHRIQAHCPIDIIPLYVRAGSILPFGPEIEYAGQENGEPLELRVYPGADGAFALYEDEGDNYNYESGQFAWIPFGWNDSGNILAIGRRTGGFPGMRERRTLVIRRMGTHESSQTVEYAGDAIVVSME